MLLAVYRLWSKTRLRHLHPWIDSWALPEMFAGVQGRGVQDASYQTAVEMDEAFVVHGECVTVGAMDIRRCFDQIIRQVVYKVAELAGMPTRVLESYKRYQESLRIRNTVAGVLGEV